MKINSPVSGREQPFSEGKKIISTTDTKGIIQYVNDYFCQISGFSQDELLGKNHNVIRHPKMPPAAFQNLWDTVKTGKAWMGIVNNWCKNGDNYWVDAYVTPICEAGHITGYQSVRVKPDPDAVKRAEAFYQRINEGDSLWHKLSGLLQFHLTGKIIAANAAGLLLMLVTGLTMGIELNIAMVTMLVVGLIAGSAMAYLIAAPWKKAAEQARKIFHNEIALHTYAGRTDELGYLLVALHAQESRLQTVTTRLVDSATNLQEVAESTGHIVEKTDEGVRKQQMEIDLVASAMHEMSATVHDIANNTVTTADATRAADKEAEHLGTAVLRAVRRIQGLSAEVREAAEVVRRLGQDSAEIGKVVDVIRAIAEQTNLLALNAAIEAARAGETGRGFAVVADEVRSLANRTQESTEEIQRVVERLQSAASNATRVMEQSEKSADEGAQEVASTQESLKSITNAMTRILDMSVQIATASEEQSAVAEEINRNVVNISRVAEDTAAASHETSQASGRLSKMVSSMRDMAKQFS